MIFLSDLPKSKGVIFFSSIVCILLPCLCHAELSQQQLIKEQVDCVNNHLDQGEVSWREICYGQKSSIEQSVSGQDFQTAEGEVMVEAPSIDIKKPQNHIKTRTHTFDLGIDPYHNNYKEPDIDVHLRGGMFGFYGSYTYRPPEGNILKNSALDVYRFETHYAQGDLNYENETSGVDKGIPNKMYEVRGLVGKDYVLEDSSLVTPYFGFGYRFLLDDGGGRLTDRNYWGYDRRSHYWYIPVGVTVGIPIDKITELGFNLEYDYFIQGTQKSYLSDGDQFTTSAFPSFDMSNHQDTGYGIRGSFRLLKRWDPLDFYVEPFVRYWNIEDSKVVDNVVQGQLGQWLEPHNTTIEAGSKFGVQF